MQGLIQKHRADQGHAAENGAGLSQPPACSFASSLTLVTGASPMMPSSARLSALPSASALAEDSRMLRPKGRKPHVVLLRAAPLPAPRNSASGNMKGRGPRAMLACACACWALLRGPGGAGPEAGPADPLRDPEGRRALALLLVDAAPEAPDAAVATARAPLAGVSWSPDPPLVAMGRAGVTLLVLVPLLLHGWEAV